MSTESMLGTLAESVFDKILPRVIAEAMATAEIQAELADPRLGLTEDDLRDYALANRSRVWDAALAELDQVRFESATHEPRWRPGLWWGRRRDRAMARRRAEQAQRVVDDWETAVREVGVLPMFRQLINERLAPLVWATMTRKEAPGLDRVRDSRFVVETGSAQRFLNLAGQIHSGAIGIAGSRGVGKSTVIESYQATMTAAISVFVPAPVQYNAHEFVLYLYAELCNAVIRRFPDRVRPETLRLATKAGWNVSVAALAFIIGGLVLGPNRTVHQLFDPGAWPLVQGWIAGALFVITAGGLITALVWLGVAAQFDPRVVRPLRWLVLGPQPRPQPELADQARELLKRIRFLQTRTTGWSGKLTIPNSELGLTRSIQRAEQPLTYPEIVGELRQFIALITARLKGSPSVIIAIDELDKIDDAEEAQAFVNEIKGVFGVTGAQFLVSVSEDALASFERRGLQVRDAFDSAFDEIIRIEPLNLADACTLLRSRVIGVSDLFSALAHCMAGGLARDIIRTARSMRAVAGQGDGIEQVCRQLVEADIQRKVHAFQQATGQLEGTPDTTSFIRALRLLHAHPATLLQMLPEFLVKGDKDKADFRQVRWQAATYVYHCASVLEVFTEALTKDRFDERRGTLESLATAKQELGTHPQLAWLMVDEFREAWELPTVPRA